VRLPFRHTRDVILPAVRLALVIGVVALVGACSSQPSASPTPADSGPASTPSASSPTTPQDLTFTGRVAGRLTTAATTCRLLLNGAQLGMTFEGAIGSQKAMLTIQVNSGYHGPGAYGVGGPIDGGANVELSSASYAGASSSNAGNLIVNPDGKTGVINADLSGGEHVAGTYSCDKITS
jgi:hypothetical protein